MGAYIKSIIVNLFLILGILGCSQFSTIESGGRVESNYKFSIIQGSTDETSTVLRLVYPGFLSPKYKVIDASTNKEIRSIKVKHFQKDYSGFKVTHLDIDKLASNTLYKLEVISSDQMWKDERTFSTIDSQKKSLKTLVASCLDDSFNDIGNKIWPMAFEHNPDLVLLIGDNLYADIYSGIFVGAKLPAVPAQLWQRHIDHAMKLKLNRMSHLKPILTTWDDHDYGVDDGDKTYKFKKESQSIFRIFFPLKKNKISQIGPGVSSFSSLNNQNIILLDNRSFRDTKKNKNGHHFGKKQREWLVKNIKTSAQFNWLISGDQFFGGYHTFESFQGLHKHEFNKFKAELKNLGKKYLFISGDRHFVELSSVDKDETGFETVEVTFSGMHAKMFPTNLEKFDNPNRLNGYAGKYNYGIIESSQDNITIKAYSLDGLEFVHKFEI